VDFGFQIVKTACQCGKNPACQISVIEKRKGKSSELPFSVRKLAVKTEKLSDWNLSLFSHPRHPMFNNEKVLPRLKCTYLHLNFNSVDDRQEFGRKFNNALKKRDDAQNNIESITERTRYLGEKNGDLSRGKKVKKGRQPSISSITTVRSERSSVLPPIPGFSSLNMDEK
jgi:hypothetical protein